MSRILVIGGYGGFGARLSRRLAAAGHQVLVGGRSRDKAAAFAADLPGAEPAQVDRDGDMAGALATLCPDLVIDAAGPFQGSGDQVPRACIAAGMAYLDLADDRCFAVGLSTLDPDARAAGVALVGGASSTPALSGAVARRLAEGLDRVATVDIVISATARSTANPAITAAILATAGQPISPVPDGGFGCQGLRRVDFVVDGVRPLRARLAGLCDVPDLALLPDRLPGRPSVTFRGGPEFALPMRMVAAASRLVSRGWLRSLRPLTGLAVRTQRLLIPFSSDRSGMMVTLKGWDGDTPVTRRWTLIAQNGDGPDIPTLAAFLLAEDLVAGRIAPQASDAGALLTLDRFEPLFASLDVRHAIEETRAPPLYARIMGDDAFARLPPLVRAIHQVHGQGRAQGEGQVRRGRSWAARLLGRIMGFPPTGDYPLVVRFTQEAGRERWTRFFGAYSFASEMSCWKGLLAERFGPMRFGFALPADGEGLAMELRRWSAFGIPMPRFLGPRITAREWQEDDRFRFDVAVALPLIGDVVRYTGWLRPA